MYLPLNPTTYFRSQWKGYISALVDVCLHRLRMHRIHQVSIFVGCRSTKEQFSAEQIAQDRMYDRNKMKRQIYFRGDPLCRAAVCIPFKTGVVDGWKAQSQQGETC